MKRCGVACLLLATGLTAAQTQGRFLRRPFLQTRRANRIAPYRADMQAAPRPVLRNALQPIVQDEGALALLKRMVRPTASYVGEQVTEVTERSGRSSRQIIKGDTQGRIRREFLSPGEWAGDVMLVTPGQYGYLHKRENRLDVALWPTEWNDREKRMFALLRRGRVAVTRVGEEPVAGRNATIIALTGAGGQAGQFQMKFWIDTETGIQLKNEKYAPGGLESRSYMTAITVNPTAGVASKDFEMGSLQASNPTTDPWFPAAQFTDLQQAASQMPFHPLEPATLPSGFRFSGAWTFGVNLKAQNRRGAILLRYSDGVSSFSLYQRQARPNGKPLKTSITRAYRRSIQRWTVAAPEGEREITYIGHLTSEQAQAVHDTLR